MPRKKRHEMAPEELAKARADDKARQRAYVPRRWIFCPTCGHRAHRLPESIQEPCAKCGGQVITRRRGRPSK